MSNKKIAILPWEIYEGRKNIGSSKIRSFWVNKYWDESEIFVQGRKYDTVIYQKCYWVEHAKLFKGIKILDLCDPDWLSWGYRIKEMIEEVDGITTSTEELAESIRKFTKKPVKCIPDRVDLEDFKFKKVHEGEAKSVVWFGYSQNSEILKPVVHFLIKNKLDLIIVSDKNFASFPNQNINISFYKWKGETAYSDIIKGDIAVNPTSKDGKWKYKSNNKTLISWCLGLPVASSPEDFKKFMSEKSRTKENVKRMKEVKEKWLVEKSVEEYKEFIKYIEKTKK